MILDRRRYSSSIRAGLASFQDGRHAPKMAARTPRWRPSQLRVTTSDDPVTRSVSPRRGNALDHGKVASRPRAGCRSSSMYRGYLHYSYNGTVGLNVILWDRSGELFPPSRRYKGLTFCHLTFSFDLRPSHLRCLGDG